MRATRLILIAGIGIVFVSVGLAGTHPTLFPARQFATIGSGPRADRVADFNQDGYDDVVIISWSGVEVHFGTPDGGLSDPLMVAPGAWNWGVGVADFDADGFLDIAAATHFSGEARIRIFLNDQLGGFEEVGHVEAETNSTSVLAVDLDGDGHADLVTSSADYGSVLVYRGMGGGQFAAPESVPTGASSYSPNFVSGDFTGNGAPDIVLSDDAEQRMILLGNDGAGNLSATTSFDLDVPIGNLVTANFDGDGKADLAVSTGGEHAAVQVFLQRNSAFEQHVYPVSLLRGGGVREIFAADVDGDGWPDLVAANWPQTELTVAVLRNLRNGRFASAVHYHAPTNPVGLAVADLDGDGAPEIIVGTNSRPWATVLKNAGDGSFIAPIAPRTASLSQRLWRVAAGDLTGNGIDDVAVGSLNGPVQILPSLGGGAFGDPVVLPVDLSLRDVAVGDVTGDGELDLIAVGAPGSQALLRNGGGFQPGPVQNMGRAWVFAADFNNNGRSDFMSDYDVALSNGDGTFTLSQNLGICDSRFPAIGDVNGDGILDIVAVCGPLRVWLGNGDGTFQPPRNYEGGQSNARVGLADLNGSGFLDTVIAGEFSVTLLEGSGDGKFSIVRDLEVGGGPVQRLLITDMNDNGRPDIVVLKQHGVTQPATVRVWLNEGDWRFSEPQQYGAGPQALDFALGDLTGDGRPDLAIVNDAQAPVYRRVLVLPNQLTRPGGKPEPLPSQPRGGLISRER